MQSVRVGRTSPIRPPTHIIIVLPREVPFPSALGNYLFVLSSHISSSGSYYTIMQRPLTSFCIAPSFTSSTPHIAYIYSISESLELLYLRYDPRKNPSPSSSQEPIVTSRYSAALSTAFAYSPYLSREFRYPIQQPNFGVLTTLDLSISTTYITVLCKDRVKRVLERSATNGECNSLPDDCHHAIFLLCYTHWVACASTC